jgi:hypothetical protein
VAYHRKQDFLPDFQAAEQLAETSYGAFYKRVDPDIAWNAYHNAAEKTDANKSVLGLMLFGRHVASIKTDVAKQAQADFNTRQAAIQADDQRLKGKWYVPKPYRESKTQKATTANFAQLERDKQNIPASIDTDEAGVMRKNFGVVNNTQAGSILLMGSDRWNLTVNDCWVVGAVHSHLPFYPASRVSKANIYDAKYILSITGRELYGLAIFGYRQVITPYSDVLGTAFEVQDAGKASGATLKSYQEAMGRLTKDGAEKAFKDAGFSIAEVGY